VEKKLWHANINYCRIRIKTNTSATALSCGKAEDITWRFAPSDNDATVYNWDLYQPEGAQRKLDMPDPLTKSKAAQKCEFKE
jgi:hypothetical protein